MSDAPPESTVKDAAAQAGFDACGIASLASPPERLGALIPWLAAGRHASMAWMERQVADRLDPARLMPGARAMVCVALLYNTPHAYSTDPGAPANPDSANDGRGWISRYAWGEDYHTVMARRLKDLEARLRTAFGPAERHRSFCDTSAVSEKAWAAAAGLGWQGKHTNLIRRNLGSWIFLGGLLTTLDLRSDPPEADHCGTCTRCLDACPTQAFPRPYELDATRCISYLTIENRGEIPPEFADALGANVYGCDICQDVCPWNRPRVSTADPAFQPRPGNLAPALEDLRGLDDEAFAARFKGSAVRRAKPAGLRRNAALALGARRREPAAPRRLNEEP